MPATEVSTTPDRDARPPTPPGTRGWPWQRIRWAGYALYVVGFAAFLRFQGIPSDRIGLALAITLLLTISVLGKGWPAFWQMLRDWLPFQAVLLVYDYSRGFASPYTSRQMELHRYPVVDVHNALGMPLHATAPIRVDLWIGRHLGLGGMPTTWVQEHLHPTTSVPWYGVLTSLTYSSHFLVMPTVAVILWLTNRERFRVWMRMVVVLAVAGVATYALYPMAPPWLADDAMIFPGPHVGRYTAEGFDLIGLHLVGGALDQGQYLVNPVAAMPSLHMAYATLAAGFFWFGKPWWAKVLLACYPLAMGLTLVYGGEHYVVDELAGVVYALAVIAGWRLLRRRRSAVGHATRSPSGQETGPAPSQAPASGGR